MLEVAGVRLRQHLTLRDAALSLPADQAPSAWDRALRTAWQAEAPAARVLATLERLPAAAEEPLSLTLGWRITNLWSEPVLLEPSMISMSVMPERLNSSSTS